MTKINRPTNYHEALTKQLLEDTLTPIDKKQRDLTERFLLPNLDLLHEDVLRIRERMDLDILNWRKKAKRAGKKVHPTSNLGQYPIGQCREIRNLAFKNISRNLRNPKFPGLNALNKFELKGGAIKGVWGIQKEKYFQNMIQAGDLAIDSANDTVDINKPKVEISTLAEAEFREIKSFEDYAKIVQTYWEMDVFPNVYIPQMALFYPMIFIRPDGKITFDGGDATLTARNILSLNSDLKTHFEMSREFIFNSDYSNRRLPQSIENALYKHFHKGKWVKKMNNEWEFQVGGDEFLTECAFYRFQDEFSKDSSPQDLIRYVGYALGTKKALENHFKLKIPRDIFFENIASGTISVSDSYYDFYNGHSK